MLLPRLPPFRPRSGKNPLRRHFKCSKKADGWYCGLPVGRYAKSITHLSDAVVGRRNNIAHDNTDRIDTDRLSALPGNVTETKVSTRHSAVVLSVDVMIEKPV